MNIEHRFVECIPDSIESGVLYISITYATAMHLCVCGCGKEVVTPFSPTDWKLVFDGETVSITPSIGNWGFPCRSHYFIKRNGIEWAGRMSQRIIDANRDYDRQAKTQQYSKVDVIQASKLLDLPIPTKDNKETSIYSRIWAFFK